MSHSPLRTTTITLTYLLLDTSEFPLGNWRRTEDSLGPSISKILSRHNHALEQWKAITEASQGGWGTRWQRAANVCKKGKGIKFEKAYSSDMEEIQHKSQIREI